jgi:hypothetical protein
MLAHSFGVRSFRRFEAKCDGLGNAANETAEHHRELEPWHGLPEIEVQKQYRPYLWIAIDRLQQYPTPQIATLRKERLVA